MLSFDFHCKENDADRVVGYSYTQDSSSVIMVIMKSGMSWVYGYDPEAISSHHFPYNENPTKANTSSLKCCLPSSDAIDRREKIHACVYGFKVASCLASAVN